ncbi:MAG: hypothetical protein AUG10_04120 [Gemmatimonadetes bacterium 13_1_20CM_2_70_10]|nr:MAG: hypothetical protein AUG10_04120 [Gemmatimonadetes bacterium 13_1_20CM_2_70_10]
MSHVRVGYMLLSLVLGAATSLRTQAVRGQVLGQLNLQPVAGALVFLLDDGGHEADRTPTNGSGNFLLRAQRPGEYSLLVLRIGYQKWQSPAFRLAAADTMEYRAEVLENPVELPVVSIEAQRQCRIAPEGGAVIAALWGEARKALILTELTREQSSFQFRIVRATRRLNEDLVPVEEATDTSVVTAFQPFASLPVESLVVTGFVRDSGGVAIYYGPDVAVLFSDAFLQRHCFRARLSRRNDPGLVGLAFEPTRGATVPDIAGVLWLDRQTAALKYLEYQYTNLEPELGDRAGGRVEFLELPSGAWIVRQWTIETPIPLRGPSGWIRTGRPSGYRVHERRVLEVLTADGRSVLR